MTHETPSFKSISQDRIGLLFDDSKHEKFPIRYYNVVNGHGVTSKPDCSYYGFVYEGFAALKTKSRPITVLSQGMYFSLSEPFQILDMECGKTVVIEVLHSKGIYPKNNFSAPYTIGGAIEETGRLKYIDGCTDSILIHPVKKGDPCLNHLHFPKNINQTPHTHPSHRIGVVAKGEGLCVTPFGNLPLVAGCIFIIKEYNGTETLLGLDGKYHEAGTHKFNTTDNSMDVIAFHPDSDFGAEDECHPMINRTIVLGVSASKIPNIQTA